MRGRAWFFVGGMALALGLLGQLDQLGPVGAAAITVGSSVILALLAHGGTSLATEAVAFGASGALAYEAVRPYLPLVAMGLLLAAIFGTRAMRSRSWRELAFHVSFAFAGGAAASWVVRANAGLETTLWMVALAVASLLASLPWLVPSDAPRTFALRRLAARARGALRFTLLRAVVAHRRLAEADVPEKMRRRLDRAFDDVIHRCERRLDARGERAQLDVRSSVVQLVRVARLAATRDALLEDLDTPAHRVAAESDTLEAEVLALGEVS